MLQTNVNCKLDLACHRIGTNVTQENLATLRGFDD